MVNSFLLETSWQVDLTILYTVQLSCSTLHRVIPVETFWSTGFFFVALFSGAYPMPMRPMGGRNGAASHAYPDYEELKRDSPGANVRIFVLLVYR